MSTNDTNIRSAGTSRAARILMLALVVGAINSGYLGWRYIALHAGLEAPGTGLCSWSRFVDCDRVLLTPEANAFVVPNALLGFGLFAAALLWWVLGRRFGPAYQPALTRTLSAVFALAAVLTLYFFRLLAGLDHFCPLCPINHVLVWTAFGASLRLVRTMPRNSAAPVRPLLLLGGACAVLYACILGAWWVAESAGVLRAAP